MKLLRNMKQGLMPALALTFLQSGALADVDTPLAQKGEVLLHDAFDREDFAPWKAIIPGFKIKDGVLHGYQEKDHGAVGRYYTSMSDVIMSFRFKIGKGQRFNVVWDDMNYKHKSHAGHICRVSVNPKAIILGDDRDGAFKKEHRAMRDDPEQAEKLKSLLKGKNSVVKNKLDLDSWHTLQIEIVGEEMRVLLDGKPMGYLKSSGIAHQTKESVHFTVTGQDLLFDDVMLWTAKK